MDVEAEFKAMGSQNSEPTSIIVDNDSDGIEDWQSPQHQPVQKSVKPALNAKAKVKEASSRRNTRSSRNNSLANIVQQTGNLTIDDEDDDRPVIIPNKKARQQAVAHAGPNAEYAPQKGETDSIKRKKR